MCIGYSNTYTIIYYTNWIIDSCTCIIRQNVQFQRSIHLVNERKEDEENLPWPQLNKMRVVVKQFYAFMNGQAIDEAANLR